MKIKILLAIMMSAVLCIPAFAQTPVTIANSDFESWTGGTSGPPDNWTNDNSDFTSSQEGTTVHGDSYSVNLTWTSQSNQDFVSDMFAVTGEELYTVYAWMYDNDIAGRLRLCFEWYDSGQAYLSASYSGVYSSDSAAWVEYSFAANAAAGAAYGKILIRQYDISGDWDGDATVFVDDVTLFEGTGGANQPPEIGFVYRDPYPTVLPDDVVLVWSELTDSDGTIDDDSLYYQTTAPTLAYTAVYHDSIDATDGYYWYTMPAQVAGTLVEYYVQVKDDDGERVESYVNNYTVSDYPSASLENGDFELWTENGATGPADSWELDASGSITGAQEGTTVHGGSYSANLTWTSQIQADCELFSNSFTITAEETYICSLYVYDNDIAGDITIYFAWDTGNTWSSNYSSDLADWQLMTYSTAAPTGATSVKVGIRCYDDSDNWDGDATVYVDDCSFNLVAGGPEEVSIYDVQYTIEANGNCYDSPRLSENISVTGTVTGINQGSYPDFYIQDCTTTDWNGIYVYDDNYSLSIGDNVTVIGSVAEYYGCSQLSSVVSVTTNSTGNSVCTTTVTSDNLNADCNGSTEAYEGVLVKLENVTCVVGPDADNVAWVKTAGASDSCAVDDQMHKYGTDNPVDLVQGQTYDYIVGIVHYYYDKYRVYPRFSSDIDDGGTTVDYTINELNYPATGGDCYDGPHSGETDITTTGIITGILGSAMSLQDPAASTYGGIWVYAGSYDLSSFAVGDLVEITADVTEYYGLTELTNVTDVTLVSSGNVVTPILVDGSDITDACDEADEAYENMLVVVSNVTIGEVADHGSYWAFDASNDTFLVDDDLLDSLPIATGEEYYTITGVHKYAYSANRLEPRSAADFQTEAIECTATNTIFEIQNSFDPFDNILDNCYPSTFVDSGIVEVCGVVTAVDNQGSGTGLFIQDPEGTTYEGILWYDLTSATQEVDLETAAIGDYYQVRATVSEYVGITELDSLVEYTLLGTNTPVPDPLVISISDLLPLGDCSFTGEAYEGVLVQIEDVTVGSSPGYGKWWITDSGSGADSVLLGPDIYDMTLSAYPPSTDLVYDYVIGIVTYDQYDDRLKLQPRMDSDLQVNIVPPPTVTASFPIDQSTLCVMFDRALDQGSAETPGNYTITSGLSVTAAALDADLVRVFLTLSPAMGNGILDEVTVANVTDSSGIGITTPVSTPFYQGFTPINMVQTTTDPGVDNTYPSDLLDAIITMRGCIIADTTAFTYNNIYISDLSGTTNNGVLCYGSYQYWDASMDRPVEGDTVILTGQVTEYYGATEISNIDDFKNVTIVGSGVAEPTYKTYDAGDFQYNTLDAYRENFEGVLVQLCDSLEIVSMETSNDTARVLIMSLTDNADTIAFDGKYTNFDSVEVGQRIDGLTGVVRWRWGYWRVQPRSNDDFDTGLNCEEGGDNYEYLPGDANMYAVTAWPPNVIGADVTYLVNYFRGISTPCLLDGFYASADANGDCSVIGADVTYLVQYFRGANTLKYCGDDVGDEEDYTPEWTTPEELPATAPAGWPNCDNSTTSTSSSQIKQNNNLNISK